MLAELRARLRATHWPDSPPDTGWSLGVDLDYLRELVAYWADENARRVEVPSGFSLFPGDILAAPRSWLERTTNLARVTQPARGGHFAPFEEPELYAQELREFFRPYRTVAADHPDNLAI